MGLIVVVDDQEIERKTFFTICIDLSIVPREHCVGVPTAEALVALIKAGELMPTEIECIFVDLQLNPRDELDRSGLEAADLIRLYVGDIPIVALTRHTELREFADVTAREFDGILFKHDTNDSVRFTTHRFRSLLDGWRRKRHLGAASPPKQNVKDII